MKKVLILALLLQGFLMLTLAQTGVLSVSTNYQVNPLGIDTQRPSLGWVLSSEQPNTAQSAYRVRAAYSEKELIKGRKLAWDSEWTSSARSTHIAYGGPPLKSFQRIYWQVKVKDNHGKSSDWSDPAWFETGFLPGTKWQAAWISPSWEEDLKRSEPSPYLREEFELKSELKRARLYISSHGLYRAEINGKRVGNLEFTPGWTSYNKRLQYQVYDVASQLDEGTNAIGIILGDGWYRGNLGFVEGRNTYGDDLAAIAELHLEYSDGSKEIIVTDENWKAGKGAIRESDIYNGELYDATREISRWSLPGFNDADWKEVKTSEIPTNHLIASEGPAVRQIERLKPIEITKQGDVWLVDMGQNMVGWVEIIAAGRRGDTLQLRHVEVLDKEGKPYYTNLRAAKQCNRYIFSGDGEDLFEPHFTFQGFRYVIVEGFSGKLEKEDITGVVIHSDMKQTGHFSCSDPLINQLQHNILWGLKGNFLDVPTDCPQRDERLGWTGDAQVFAPTACFNMQAAAFFKKWLKDLSADQKENGEIPDVVPDILGNGGRTGWADAGVVIPWTLYLEYGDTEVLKEQYESMKAWISYMEKHAGTDRIWKENWHYGDWLSFDDSTPSYMGAYTSTDLIATAYYHYSTKLMRKIAGILGEMDDEIYFKQLEEEVKTAFNEEFVTPNGRLVSHTQTAYTLALAFGLLDQEQAGKSAEHLAGDVQRFRHITTGFLGTPLISKTLTETGRIDLAYELLIRREYPSWLYPVTMGATTIWERWDGQKPDLSFQTPGMNSFNHYAYGAIGKWLYEVVAGIGIDENNPGYKHILIHPRPGGGLSSARASYQSLYGEIVSAWKLEGENMFMEVQIPVNSRATIYVPGKPSEIHVNGKALDESNIEYIEEDGKCLCSTGSGNYEIACIFE